MRGDSGFSHRPVQQSIASLPEGQQDAAMAQTDRAKIDNPAVEVGPEGNLLHVCNMGGEWQVWLNCNDAEFTGLCCGVGKTRDDAVRDAVALLEAAVERLQMPAFSFPAAGK